MKIKIHSIEGGGDLNKEAVWLDVQEDVPNLAFFAICDSTYTNEHQISNELRHIYWFPARQVKKGDWIKLMTKEGVSQTATNDRGTATHIFFWNLGRTIWNKAGDCAVLFGLESWASCKM